MVIVAEIGPPVPPGFVGVVGELSLPPQAVMTSAVATANKRPDQIADRFMASP
jgi:hypothetical protein